MSEPWKGATSIRWHPDSRVSVQAEGLDGPSLEVCALEAARILRAYVKSRRPERYAITTAKDKGINLISATFITDGGVSNE